MHLTKLGLAVFIGAALSVATLAPRIGGLADQLTGTDFPTALLALLGLTHLALSGFFLLTLAAAVSGKIRAPGARRLLLATGVLVVLSQPATAQELDGLHLPDRPSAAPILTSSAVVQPGDTLWAIAGRSTSDPTAIAASVAAWHRENRDVIGADPHLLLPGQVLREPR